MTSSPGFELSHAVVAFRWASEGVDRTIAVYEDASVWCWQLRAIEPELQSSAGTFRIDAPGETLSSATRLAALIDDQPSSASASSGLPSGLPSGLSPERPTGLGLTVTTRSGARWIAAEDEIAGDIGAFVQPLVTRVLSAPLSVVRLGAALLAPPTLPGLPTTAVGLAASFTSTGSQPVSFFVDPSSIALEVARGNWQPAPPPPIGIMSAEGALLDGLYGPAAIDPGFLAVMTVNMPDGAVPIAGPTAGPDAGPSVSAAGPIALRLRGTITLAGPGSEHRDLAYSLVAPMQDRR